MIQPSQPVCLPLRWWYPRHTKCEPSLPPGSQPSHVITSCAHTGNEFRGKINCVVRTSLSFAARNQTLFNFPCACMCFAGWFGQLGLGNYEDTCELKPLCLGWASCSADVSVRCLTWAPTMGENFYTLTGKPSTPLHPLPLPSSLLHPHALLTAAATAAVACCCLYSWYSLALLTATATAAAACCCIISLSG